MLDQNAFRDTLRLVQEIAAASDRPVSREEALSYFQDMELSAEHKELVYQYLQPPPEKEEPFQTGEAKDYAGSVEAKSVIAAGKKERKAGKKEQDNCTAHFRMYMQEVAGISRLKQEQEQQLYRRLLAGDEGAVEEISRQWLSRIITMAREYQNENFYLDDLVQEGNMALLTALHEYLGRQETEELEKKLVEAVMDAMEAFMGTESGALQQEETILAKVSLLHEAKKLLMDQSGEEPTLEELADYTRLTRQEINDIMDLMEKAQRPS